MSKNNELTRGSLHVALGTGTAEKSTISDIDSKSQR